MFHPLRGSGTPACSAGEGAKLDAGVQFGPKWLGRLPKRREEQCREGGPLRHHVERSRHEGVPKQRCTSERYTRASNHPSATASAVALLRSGARRSLYSAMMSSILMTSQSARFSISNVGTVPPQMNHRCAESADASAKRG
jgi:hypothetical protein